MEEWTSRPPPSPARIRLVRLPGVRRPALRVIELQRPRHTLVAILLLDEKFGSLATTQMLLDGLKGVLQHRASSAKKAPSVAPVSRNRSDRFAPTR
jgi:hypothetical protein